MIEPSKRDWKLYRANIGKWQEHYMEKLVKEYADYLCSDLPASTKFWEMERMLPVWLVTRLFRWTILKNLAMNSKKQ